MNKHTATPIPAEALAEARKLLDKDVVDLARELLATAARPGESWETTADRRDWIIQAARAQREAQLVLDIEQARLDEEAAKRVKGDAVDAYRAQITTTIPAHRIETRINGFKDGWEAAMLALRGEDTK